MTKSKTDKHLTLSYKKLSPKVTKGGKNTFLKNSKSDLHLTLSYKKLSPKVGVGNGKIDVFKELTPHSRTF